MKLISFELEDGVPDFRDTVLIKVGAKICALSPIMKYHDEENVQNDEVLGLYLNMFTCP